ncbi:hypothetical protein BD289DRAFT_113658 [Coniella lustricola]|uniref:Uncharacterized protein n=1 Tax=Coniella lustricola TaxID=2025994 RepID=A0A2T3AGD4_9PEZI|nr:hypothetical protein BD289DRAFT_113658 [Coniella lustricola]
MSNLVLNPSQHPHQALRLTTPSSAYVDQQTTRRREVACDKREPQNEPGLQSRSLTCFVFFASKQTNKQTNKQTANMCQLSPSLVCSTAPPPRALTMATKKRPIELHPEAIESIGYRKALGRGPLWHASSFEMSPNGLFQMVAMNINQAKYLHFYEPAVIANTNLNLEYFCQFTGDKELWRQVPRDLGNGHTCIISRTVDYLKDEPATLENPAWLWVGMVPGPGARGEGNENGIGIATADSYVENDPHALRAVIKTPTPSGEWSLYAVSKADSHTGLCLVFKVEKLLDVFWFCKPEVICAKVYPRPLAQPRNCVYMRGSGNCLIFPRNVVYTPVASLGMGAGDGSGRDGQTRVNAAATEMAVLDFNGELLNMTPLDSKDMLTSQPTAASTSNGVGKVQTQARAPGKRKRADNDTGAGIRRSPRVQVGVRRVSCHQAGSTGLEKDPCNKCAPVAIADKNNAGKKNAG